MKMKELKKEIGLVKADRAYKSMLIISIGALIIALVGMLFMYLKTEKEVRDLSKKVIIINDGTAIQGSVNAISETDLFKLQSHNVLKMGIDYMYSFSASNYDDRIDMAKAYFGRSGNEILQSYINDNVRSKVLQNNLRVDVAIKTTDVEIIDNNFKGKAVFEQSFINGDVVKKRLLEMRCDFIKTQVSTKNGFGILIDNVLIEEIKK